MKVSIRHARTASEAIFCSCLQAVSKENENGFQYLTNSFFLNPYNKSCLHTKSI